MDAAKCSRAEAQQLIEQRQKREAQEEAAAEAKALSAMAARSQESGKVWAVELDPYNKYCATKPKLLSTHRSEQEATRRAKDWWANDTFGVDNLTMLSAESEPYSANACIEIGGGVMTVSVIQVDISDLKGSMLKKALQLRGAPVSGSAQELRDRLKALIDSERTVLLVFASAARRAGAPILSFEQVCRCAALGRRRCVYVCLRHVLQKKTRFFLVYLC